MAWHRSTYGGALSIVRVWRILYVSMFRFLDFVGVLQCWALDGFTVGLSGVAVSPVSA